MKTEILKQVGLTNTEIKIYLALAELGPCLASSIARKLQKDRSVIYHIIDNLLKKGLVNYVVKENRKYFNITNPKRILDLLKEKESAVIEIIPDINKLRKSVKETPVIEVYQGKEGLKTVLNDVLDEGKDYYVIGYTGATPIFLKYWFPHWQKRRIKLKIKRNIIFPHKMKNKEITKYPLTKAKYLPKNYQTSSSTFTYGKDKVLIFLPTRIDFTGIVIKSKEVWESYKNAFDLLWKISK